MILWLLAYSNINRNIVRLSNLYSLAENALWSSKRLYDFYASSSCLHVAFTDASPREAFCYACMMLVRNHHETNFSLFEPSPRTVKKFANHPIVLCLSRFTFEQFPRILAVSIFTRQHDATLKVHRFRRKIDRGKHQHCHRRGPHNGMLLTWRWRRRWRIEVEIFLLRSEQRRCRSSN